LDINNLLHASSWQDVEQLVNYIGAESLLHEAFSSLCFFLIFTSYLQMQMDLLRKVGAAREVNCFLLFGH